MDLLRYLTAGTRYCGLFGHPVKHSASPAMQNAGLVALGLGWRYIAFDVVPDRLGAALAGAKAMGFIGLNLTIPHKVAALGLLDAVDESVRRVGAVNTIRFEARDVSGNWVPVGNFTESPDTEIRAVGFNTDAGAIVRVVREDLGIELAGAVVFLLGAGGAGRTAALELAAQGVSEIWLLNRTKSKAEAVIAEIGERWPAVKARIGYPPGGVDLVINATSVGLRAEDPLPFDAGDFEMKRARAAFEMIYRPAETRFLRAAKAAGCRCTNGVGMLLYQGAAALELWSGRRAPLEQMRHALEAEIDGK